MVQHVVCEGDLSLLVANDGELQVRAGDLVDVADPSSMRLDGVGGQANELDASSGELGFEFSESTELGSADWGVILRVREQNDPAVANELVEVNRSVGGFGLEVGGNGTESETATGSVTRSEDQKDKCTHGSGRDMVRSDVVARVWKCSCIVGSTSSCMRRVDGREF